ncbi:MAG: protein kinase [Alistipes sp.]|nr:protein kinase [Alistipes sp.]
MVSISDIVDALANPYTPWRSLRNVEVVCCDGMPQYFTGNASVIFHIRLNGDIKILKCYTRRNAHLKAIYGERFLPAELCVSNILGQRHWIDCLVADYVEGSTLHEMLCQPLNKHQLQLLAEEFDRFAADLLDKEYAHGDLKPENIIVCKDGTMRAIDWDAAFVPTLNGNKALEIGTAAYQHPQRTTEHYDKHIDDYSIAFISTLLHAYATDPKQAEHYRQHHEPQAHPRDITLTKPNYNFVHHLHIGTTPERNWLDDTLDLFASLCMARQYCIARLLRDNTPHLFSLKRLFKLTTVPSSKRNLMEADVSHGLWGYSIDGKWIIAPYFDECNDPKEELFLVRLGNYKHLLSLDGKRLFTTPASTKIRIKGNDIIVQAAGEAEHIINSKKLEGYQ